MTATLRRSPIDRIYPLNLNDRPFDSCSTRADMTCSILSLLIATVFSLSQVWGIRQDILVPVSNATCQPEYAWMNNAEQLDPCLAVAYVIAACAGDSKSLHLRVLYEILSCMQLGHNLLCLLGIRIIRRVVRRPLLVTGMTLSSSSPNTCLLSGVNSSWSCYNLMMACTLCQNPAYTSDITT